MKLIDISVFDDIPDFRAESSVKERFEEKPVFVTVSEPTITVSSSGGGGGFLTKPVCRSGLQGSLHHRGRQIKDRK